MATDPLSFDPVTLRAIAAMSDERAEFHARQCQCNTHQALRSYSLEIAARLRTMAIQVELHRRQRTIARVRALPGVVPRVTSTCRFPGCERDATDGHNHPISR